MRFLVLLALVGCTEQTADRSLDIGDGTRELPTLHFNADWTVSISGSLVAGDPARIQYDVARLPNCRATYNGLPAWGISASFNADGGWGHSANVTTGQATFIVPAGRDLNIWFFNSDEHGCTGYDSDYGRNFHFPIYAPPIIHFRHVNYAVTVDGTLRAGDDLMVDYELARSPWCRQDYNGYQTWDVVAHWRIDGGDVHDFALTVVADVGRDSIPLSVFAPAGSRDFEIWFENTDRTGCRAWDSDYGRNFHFALQ